MSNKKIGIVTLYGNNNFGNKLQNYALQTYLEKQGCIVDTLIINNLPKLNASFSYKIKNFVKTGFKKNIFNLINKKFYDKTTIVDNKELQRINIFKQFSTDFLNEIFLDYLNINFGKKIDEYDYFVIGSDQVWGINAAIYYYKSFLFFASPNKRLSYAGSFGIPKLPSYVKPYFKKYFMEMEAISVREESGAKIVEELLNIKVPIHVDPTMLLSVNEWSEIALENDISCDDGYILAYFLKENKKRSNKIRSFAYSSNLKIIELMNKDDFSYISGPQEYLGYIKNAKFLFTDSFHGCVFAILFGIPFKVYKRGQMNCRINTLLKKFMVNNNSGIFMNDKEQFLINSSKTNQVLQMERMKVDSYFRQFI